LIGPGFVSPDITRLIVLPQWPERAQQTVALTLPEKIVTGKIVLVIGNKIKYDFAAWSKSGVKCDINPRFFATRERKKMGLVSSLTLVRSTFCTGLSEDSISWRIRNRCTGGGRIGPAKRSQLMAE
jgi:hypothetical protein